jgi:hypothetical protein
MKFCRKCGAELIPHEPPRFDEDTGEKVKDTCPTGICYHAGVDHDYVYKRSIFGTIHESTCRRNCGYYVNSD